MAEDRKKKQKKVTIYTTGSEEKKRYVHESLFLPKKDEVLVLHHKLKIK